MVSLPLWAVFAVSFGSPLLAFLGVLLAQVIGRKGAKELETRSKREETLRTLRWAAELTVSDDPRVVRLGVAQLTALTDSDMLDQEQHTFVDAAIETVLENAVSEVDEAGADAEVVRDDEAPALESSSGQDVESRDEKAEGDAHG